MPPTPATLQAVAADRAATDTRLDQVTRDLTAAWATSWAAQDAQLTAILAGLVAAAAAAWPTRRQLNASFRLQIAFAGLQFTFVRLADLAAALIETAAQEAARSAAAAQAAMIVSQLPPGVGLTDGVAALADDDITDLARRARKAAAETLQSMPGQIGDAIRGEVIRGHRSTDPRRAIEQVLNGAQQHSSAALARTLLVARTEIMDAHRAAAQATQDTAADLLSGWAWISRLDTDVCPSCWALHGTTYPLSEPGPLDHPAGRCRRVPVLKSWADLGLPGTEPTDATPDAEAVFRALPRADQLRIMGPGRLHLLDTGQVAWTDLARRRDNPGWRPSYTVVPLKDLT
ncbi:phage minor head protein [Actinomadura sp. WMMA1423]|uniref:phage minor head protein n=1 Tax=Actinomadura sp. WMMA1423 TaxID=2591108 RepID=UPI00114656F5|nr:phage minor head protein [Actinomadura sp. WMMA1423]